MHVGLSNSCLMRFGWENGWDICCSMHITRVAAFLLVDEPNIQVASKESHTYLDKMTPSSVTFYITFGFWQYTCTCLMSMHARSHVRHNALHTVACILHASLTIPHQSNIHIAYCSFSPS